MAMLNIKTLTLLKSFNEIGNQNNTLPHFLTLKFFNCLAVIIVL